jgi:hypothetical protein
VHHVVSVFYTPTGGNNKKPRADAIDPLLVDAFTNMLRLLLLLFFFPFVETWKNPGKTQKKKKERDNC